MKCRYSKLIGYTRGAVTIKGAVIYQSLRYFVFCLVDDRCWSIIGRLRYPTDCVAAFSLKVDDLCEEYLTGF